MKRISPIVVLALWLFCPRSASAEQRFIIRTNLGLNALQQICFLNSCSVVRSLDGSLDQLFLVTTSDLISPSLFLNVLRLVPGIVDAEIDQALMIRSGLATTTIIPVGLSENASIGYFGSRVWSGYANQPAAQIVRVSEAQQTFGVTGSGVIADIDTGVDPTHPALAGVLLSGYDFTRNQPGASELPDYPFAPPPPCPNCSPAIVNQQSAAVLDQSSAAILEGAPYAAFGHGTMVVGILHLVAPTAHILPLKSFRADGSGYLSDILRAVYYAVQNQANIINMSFDFAVPSQEMGAAISYANAQNVVCVASAGNDGKQELVYPAALPNVIGVASTSDLDTRSTFSNYGSDVWIAAPGEAIITTYPFATYSAGWGTSFSAPFVSGGASLAINLNGNASSAAIGQALAHGQRLTPDLGNGRLDIYQELASMTP